MPSGRIDWEHPPSTRQVAVATGPRLLVNGLVLIGCGVIAFALVGALTGAPGVSAQGLREFFLDGLPGSTPMAWAVLAAVSLAAAYALYDLLRLLRILRRPSAAPTQESPGDHRSV